LKPWRIAVAYIAFSVLALALFATPLWYGWRVNVGTLRVFVPEDLQALPELFHRQGADAVTAAVQARSDPAGHEVVVFAGPSHQVLAGTLRRWPTEIPDVPGTYGHVIDRGDGTRMRIVVTQVTLPGGYRLLMGRQSAGLMSLQELFSYGMAGALTIVVGLGAALAWILARRASAARQSEERYALAMEAAGDGHTDWNLQTGEHYISPRLLQICGFAPDTTFRDRAEWVSRLPFHPEDRSKWERAVADHFAGHERNFKMELRLVVQDEVRWTSFHFLSTCDAAGKPIRWSGSIADISEQKKAGAALRASEERFALAVAGSNDGVFDVDFAAQRVFFSARARELSGLPPAPDTMTLDEYLHGLPLHPDDRPRRSAALQAHLDGRAKAYEGEFRMRQLDGQYRWRRIHGLCVRDTNGIPRRMAGSISDVDSRRRAEDALRLSEERYGLAMGVAEEGHIDWNVQSGEFFASAQAERVLNVVHDVECRTLADFVGRVIYHPEDRERVAAEWNTAFTGSDVEHEVECRILRGEAHETRWIRTRWKIFRGAAAQAERVIGVVSDITERKQAEDELRKMEAELRRSQRLEALGTLAGGIAHDFNNILGAILGYSEMAMRDAESGTRLRRDLDSILAAGERGRALVDRVLAFSRSGVAERISVHVEAVVQEALDQIAANLPASVSIAPHLRAGRAAMLGDSTQVHQVVMNLVSNAVQAMPKGGVLRVEVDAVHLDSARPATVGSLAAADYVVIKIGDTGDGIRPDVFERMFDPFFTTKEIGVGSGLGLSLVHGIVTDVGGAIDVTTELGKGTTFTVYVPRTGDAPDWPVDEDRPLPRGEGQRVLVVDDEEPLVRLAAETLEHLGYVPTSFTSSVAALTAFRTDPSKFDVVLTDERMPELSGSALIREMREIRETIPIVLMSGYLGMDGVDADVALRKPLTTSDLAAGMARALRA
jgi:PAS domain S-box-containing protein